MLAGCAASPVTKLAESKPAATISNAVPYHWTLGNAPQAHKDMVAEFGKVGLKPGEYVWATAVPAQGDTRIVVDLLTQMTYVYRGDKLGRRVEHVERQDRATSRPTAIGRSSRNGRSTARRNTTMRRCRSCSASTNMASPSTAA